MRVLYLSDTYRPCRTACANRSSVLAEALRAAGHDVSVLASSDSLIGFEEGFKVPDGLIFYRSFPLVEKTPLNRLRNNLGGAVEARRAAEGMGDFDVVVCSTPPLLLAASAVCVARRKGARLVLDVRDIWPDVACEMGCFSPRGLCARLFDRVARDAYRAADLVVSVSPGKVEKLARRVPGGRVALVPNGVDESFLDAGEDEGLVDRLRLGLKPVCAYVGNIGLAQGLDVLVDMAAARPDVRFLLFGTGAERRRLEERARRESIGNVEFCGTVDVRGVRTVLRHSAMSFVPLVSSRLCDSIPTKMYEALACGCPVLLAAKGDAADLLDRCGLGASAAPEDTSALLSAFDRLLEHPFSDLERERAAAWVVENHSRQKFARAFVEEIEALGARHA